MLKPVRIAVATLAATAAIGMSPTGVGAQVDGGGATSAVTATITTGSVGSRSITLANPVALTSALNTSTLNGSLATTVTEAARTGTNAWSVTAAIGPLVDTSVPVNTLANTNVTVSSRRVDQVAGGGTATAAGGTTAAPVTDAGEVVSAARTLFSTDGQLNTLVYTGTYASTSNWSLALPNGTKIGAYTGTITLTLVQ